MERIPSTSFVTGCTAAAPSPDRRHRSRHRQSWARVAEYPGHLLALLLLPLLANAEPLTSIESGCGVTSVAEQYPVGHLFRYGAVGDALTDTTAVWNRALCSVSRSPSQRLLQIPTGSFRFASRPDYISASMVIRGEATDTSILIADYNETNAVLGFLQNNPGQGGIELRNFRVHKGATVTGGAGIAFVSSPTVAAGFIFIDSVVVTTFGGTWNYALFFDGEAKTTAPLGAKIRVASQVNVNRSAVTLRTTVE